MKYFAELLSHLNNVTLSIETDCLNQELSCVSPNQLVLVSPGRVSETINLPAEVELNGTAATKHRIQQLSSRLKYKAISSNIPKQTLKPKFTTPTCHCGSPLTKSIKWRQLPSEHWAELMDLWHCHKPSTPNEGSSGMYELAINGFHPKPGLAYYSDTYYLVHTTDLAAANHSSNCNFLSTLGTEVGSKKIWKWELSSSGAVSPVVAIMLAQLIDAHAVFTFIVNSKLIFWVLNASTNYTYTGCSKPITGAKVLYGDPDKLSMKRPDAEPITLPDEAFEKLTNEMETCNQSLPVGARSMGPWKLTLLGDPSQDIAQTQL